MEEVEKVTNISFVRICKRLAMYDCVWLGTAPYQGLFTVKIFITPHNHLYFSNCKRPVLENRGFTKKIFFINFDDLESMAYQPSKLKIPQINFMEENENALKMMFIHLCALPTCLYNLRDNLLKFYLFFSVFDFFPLEDWY